MPRAACMLPAIYAFTLCSVAHRDYKEYNTDTTVKFVVKISAEKLAQAEQTGLHKVFKLQNNITSNMVSFCDFIL